MIKIKRMLTRQA